MTSRNSSMRKPRLSPPVRRTRRRWRVPPAITHGEEAFEGAGILEEFEARLGLVLWRAARDVTLWASAPEERRGELFREGAEPRQRAAVQAERLEPAVERPLLELSELLGHPHALTGELAASACLQVAQWADERGARSTALAFAQSAGYAAPMDAATAYTVARLARRRAEYARAESWFRRTVALSRQTGDWNAYSMAFLGLGNLYVQRGNLPVARRFYVRALRSARRHSLHSAAGMAFHDLLVLSVAAGRADDVERYARGAYDEYGSDHPRLSALAHDVAYFWMERGYHARALLIFRALLPHISRSGERVMVLANIAHAEAAAGDRARFEEAWSQVWDGVEGAEGAAEALVELARAAASLGDWTRAGRAAERALAIASDRGEAKSQLAAEAALEAVREHRATEATPVPPLGSAAEEADALAQELVRSLSQAAAPV